MFIMQVSEVRARLAKVAGLPPGHGAMSPAEVERRQRAQQAMIALNLQKQALQVLLCRAHHTLCLSRLLASCIRLQAGQLLSLRALVYQR